MKYDELKHTKKEFKNKGMDMLYRLSCGNNIELNDMCEYVYLKDMTDYLINIELYFLEQYIRTSMILNIEPFVKYELFVYKKELLTNLKLYQRKSKIEKIKKKNVKSWGLGEM